MNYDTYKAAIITQGSNCYMTREAWERARAESNTVRETIFQTCPGAQIAQGWYKHIFSPGEREPERLGPFATEAEAHAS